jgi:DnaK suppressor protein
MTSPVADELLAQRRRTDDLLASLRAELADIIASAQLVATDDEHDPEGATIAFERSRVDSMVHRALDHLAELVGALERVGDGRYGSCERCGEAISAERLAARPASMTCISCAGASR